MFSRSFLDIFLPGPSGSVLISSCSATLGSVWEQVSARGSRGSGQWCVKSPRVIRSQVETTQSLARECDEPEMRTTRRCNIQSSHWGASCYRVTIIITRSHAPGQVQWNSDDVNSFVRYMFVERYSINILAAYVLATEVYYWNLGYWFKNDDLINFRTE